MISRRALMAGAAGAVVVGGGIWYALGRGPRTGVRRNRFGDYEQTVRVGELPVFAQQNADVQAVYRFAASDRGQALETVPCFCGCGSVGHVSNRDCYVTSRTATAVTYTSHGGG